MLLPSLLVLRFWAGLGREVLLCGSLTSGTWISRMLGDCRVWTHLIWPQRGQLALLPVDQPRYASWCGRLMANMVSVLHTFLYAYCLQRDCWSPFHPEIKWPSPLLKYGQQIEFKELMVRSLWAVSVKRLCSLLCSLFLLRFYRLSSLDPPDMWESPAKIRRPHRWPSVTADTGVGLTNLAQTRTAQLTHRCEAN